MMWVLYNYTALYAWNVKKKKFGQIIEVKYKSEFRVGYPMSYKIEIILQCP